MLFTARLKYLSILNNLACKLPRRINNISCRRIFVNSSGNSGTGLNFQVLKAFSTISKMATDVGGISEAEMQKDSEGEEIKTEEVPPKEESESDAPNPLAYLDRDDFTSEIYKIEVKGLPKFYGFKELKKLLNNKLQVNAHKIKPNIKGGFMFVTFKSEEERQSALKAIDGYKWKNRTLTAVLAKAAMDPLVQSRAQKRPHEEIDKGECGLIGENESMEDVIKRVTIPSWNIPYPEQLSTKMNTTRKIAKDITKRIYELHHSTGLDMTQDIICPIEEIKPSPVTEEYRNKSEFTMGYNPETSLKTVGFRISSYKSGSVAIAPISHLIHLPQKMIQVALAFQDFIRSSPLNTFDPETNQGCWKHVTTRTTCDGQLMVMLLINPKNLSTEELESIKSDLISTFSKLEVPKITSFYWKHMESSGQQERNAPELLFGEATITETVLGLNFMISPEAFFQINIKATEVLYSTIGSLLESDPNTTVLDVCCGTGTIGISIANKCGQVLGIEMVESAVQDANKNAEVNGLSEKCQFYAGKAEDIIDVVLAKAKFRNIVAIVDPPRSGLHQRVLFLLRKCEKINKIIYVSCDAKAASRNFVDLARPPSKAYKGQYFIPKLMIPVDLFPHCHHSELIVVLERNQKEKEDALTVNESNETENAVIM